MILTEIKHLNVQISEFEEPIFDQNILPVFITPLILKEVEARKKSKHKIETLNPEKKLNFRIVSFNVIVEELAARINKIALDLEPNYFIDPSYYNSLPYDVRAILKKKTLKDEKKVIAEASYRIAMSTLRGKKHILYARCRITHRQYRYRYRYKHRTKNGYKALYRYKKKRTSSFGNYSEAANVRGENINPILKLKNINKYRKLNFFPVTLRYANVTQPSPSGLVPSVLTPTFLPLANKVTLFNNADSQQCGSQKQIGAQPSHIGRLEALNRLKQNLQSLASFNQTVPVRQLKSEDNKLLFSGWIPTSKGALMLLEDEGWDLDLLSNRNKATQRLKKLRPFIIRKLRRLRRLRRLRLMSINLYLHRSNNAKKKNLTLAATSSIRARVNVNPHVEKFLQKRKWKRNNSHLKIQIANLDNQSRNNSNISKLKNEGALGLHKQLRSSQQGVQNQRLTLGTCQGLTFTNREVTATGQPDRLNNKYLIKRNNNKLNFIINWIGDNFSYSDYLQSYNYNSSYSNYSNNSKSFVQTSPLDAILLAQRVRCPATLEGEAAGNAAFPSRPVAVRSLTVASGCANTYAAATQQPQQPSVDQKEYPNQSTDLNVTADKSPLLSWYPKQSTVLIEKFYANAATQRLRLNKKNISEIFLVQTKKPIKLPTLEELELPELPVLNKKQKVLAQIALFKAAKVKAKENAKLYWASRKTKFLRKRYRKQQKAKWRSKKRYTPQAGSFRYQVGGALRPSRPFYAPYRFAPTLASPVRQERYVYSRNLVRVNNIYTGVSVGSLARSFGSVAGNKSRCYVTAALTNPAEQSKPATNKFGLLWCPSSVLQVKKQSSLTLWGKATLSTLAAKSQSKPNASFSRSLATTLASPIVGKGQVGHTSRLSAIKSKVKNWKKKKDLSAVLLKKTWERYVNFQLRKINLFSEPNLPVNRKQVIDNYAKLYIKNLNRFKLLAKVTQPKAWDKIARLLNLAELSFVKTDTRYPGVAVPGLSAVASSTKNRKKKVIYPDPATFVHNRQALPEDLTPSGGRKTKGSKHSLPYLPEDRSVDRDGYAALRSKQEKVTSRINQPKLGSTRRRTRLFWAIIKLYSNSFNPIFNSLNNQYLTLPCGASGASFLGKKSTAQIQILKNNNNDPLSPTELTRKEHSPTLIDGWMPALRIKALLQATAQQEGLMKRSLPAGTQQQGSAGSGKNKTLGTVAVKRENKPTLTKETKATKLAKSKTNSVPLALPSNRTTEYSARSVQGTQYKIPSASTQLTSRAGVSIHPLATLRILSSGKKGQEGRIYNVLPLKEDQRASVDNKRFLFLYFIVPIFFATLKNSIAGARPSALRSVQPSLSEDEVNVAAAALGTQHRSGNQVRLQSPLLSLRTQLLLQQRQVEKRTLKNLTNQRKQLRALIKLMLNSGSALLRNRQWIRRNRAYPPYGELQRRSSSKSINPFLSALKLQGLKDRRAHILALRSQQTGGKGQKKLMGPQLQFRTADLLKWSVSLIAQSLAPLKRKNEYYSLIFFKILKTKGFLDLKKKKIKAEIKARRLRALKGAAADPSSTQSRALFRKTHTGLPVGGSGTAVHSKQQDLQGKNKISLPKKGKVKLSVLPYGSERSSGSVRSVAAEAETVTESDTNKIPLVTYYPGGRYISDWKRITKIIWQEEYKFNAVYRRAKNSLKLTKINTKKKLKNRYTILTVLKLWNIIKITSIKSVASLKLQVNFIKFDNANKNKRGLLSHSALAVRSSEAEPSYALQSKQAGGRRRSPTKTYSQLAAKMLCWKHLGVEYPHLPLGSKKATTTIEKLERLLLPNRSAVAYFRSKAATIDNSLLGTNASGYLPLAQWLENWNKPWGYTTSSASNKLITTKYNKIKNAIRSRKGAARLGILPAYSVERSTTLEKQLVHPPLRAERKEGKGRSFEQHFMKGWLQRARSSAIYNLGTTNKKKYKKLKNAIKNLDTTIKNKKRTDTVFTLIIRSDKITKALLLLGRQVNFLENLKYLIIKLILSVLETINLKNRATLLAIKHRSLIKPEKLNSLLEDSATGPQDSSDLEKKTNNIIAYIIQQVFSFTFYDNYISWIKLNNFFKQREATNATNLNKKLTWLIKYIDSLVPLIFSIHSLDPFKKLRFLNKNISLTVAASFQPYLNSVKGCGRPSDPSTDSATNLLNLPFHTDGNKGSVIMKVRSRALAQSSQSQLAETKKITNLQSQAAKNFTLIRSIEFYKNYNNLVNAKLTIIGKIRSIKLVELLDKIKEGIIKAEELAALERVADITYLNLINKKKSRRLNSSKYLNKKNILLSNRIKILQTVETIKTDFIFEPKLDSNALSKTPVSLLYYSNLQPLTRSDSVLPSVQGYGTKPENRNQSHASGPQAGKGKNAEGMSVALRNAAATVRSQQTTAIDINREEAPAVLSSFLRELSIYNRETKGVINYFSKIVSYNFNANNNKISSSITDLLEASFKAMHCLISKPVFVITPKKVTIQLFYFLMVAKKTKLRKIRKRFKSRFNNKGKQRIYQIYKKKRLIEAKNLNLYKLNELFSEQFELLCGNLNKIFNKPVELNLIRLHYPTEDSNILANFMDILINKVKLAKIYRKLFKGSIIKTLITLKKRKYNDISIIPAFLTGLNIKVAGRIMTQRIKPRKTINLKNRGVTARGKINYLNFARLTNKNKRGSYSITVSAGQNLFK